MPSDKGTLLLLVMSTRDVFISLLPSAVSLSVTPRPHPNLNILNHSWVWRLSCRPGTQSSHGFLRRIREVWFPMTFSNRCFTLQPFYQKKAKLSPIHIALMRPDYQFKSFWGIGGKRRFCRQSMHMSYILSMQDKIYADYFIPQPKINRNLILKLNQRI